MNLYDKNLKITIFDVPGAFHKREVEMLFFNLSVGNSLYRPTLSLRNRTFRLVYLFEY